MTPSHELRDKVTIVTGASTGIGRALALELAGAGAKLVLAARDEAALAQVAAECQARGGGAVYRRTDVTSAVDCAGLVDLAIREHGRLDVLVNNAGMSMSARFDALEDLAIFERLLQVNFLGAPG